MPSSSLSDRGAVRILYCNLNRMKEAHDLLGHGAKERDVHIVCCSEPNWKEMKEEELVYRHKYRRRNKRRDKKCQLEKGPYEGYSLDGIGL